MLSLQSLSLQRKMHVSSGDKKSHPSSGKSRNHYSATPYDTEHETRLYVDSSPAGL